MIRSEVKRTCFARRSETSLNGRSSCISIEALLHHVVSSELQAYLSSTASREIIAGVKSRPEAFVSSAHRVDNMLQSRPIGLLYDATSQL